MKVFLSWSKDLSRDVAQYFAEWLPGVIQECSSPFISSDIDKGEPWFETITTSLVSTDLGIVFITPENQDAVWLNFEAGAMLNKFGKSGVCPVLVGLKKGDYDGPLKNLQLTELTDEADVRQLLGTVNKKCANPLDQAILDKMLAVFWSDLQTKIAELLEQHAKSGHPTNAKRNLDDKVDELLSLIRGMAAKDSVVDMRLTEANARLEEFMARQMYPPAKKFDPKETRYGLRDAIDDGVLSRIANSETGRKERLARFAAEHGSLDVILKSTDERAMVVDAFNMGREDVELLIHSKNSKSPKSVMLSDVTTVPF